MSLEMYIEAGVSKTQRSMVDNGALVETTDKPGSHTLPHRRFRGRMDGRSKTNQADHGRILEAILARNGGEA